MRILVAVYDPVNKCFTRRGKVLELAIVPQPGNKISYKPFDSEQDAYVYNVVEVMFQEEFQQNLDDLRINIQMLSFMLKKSEQSLNTILNWHLAG